MSDGSSQTKPATGASTAPSAGGRPILSAEGLGKDYPSPRGELHILEDCSLELSPGDTVAIMGPSGSGKSTLLAILGTLEPPSRGRLVIDGHDVLDYTEPQLAALRSRTIGFVFQDHLLLPYCTAIDNVLVPTLAANHNAPPSGGGYIKPDDALRRAEQLLSRVGLADRQDHRPTELSGGEQQRTAIARALINRPRLLLADEPTGNLDSASADAVAKLLLEVAREQRVALVAATHSKSFADQFSRRFELIGGRLAPMSSDPARVEPV